MLEAPLSPVVARLLARARREWESRQFDAADRSLDSALALAPGDPRAVRMVGMVARCRGDYARAAGCLRQVMPVWPDDPFLHTELGLTLAQLGELADAIEQFRRACALAPDSASAWFNLGESLRQHARAKAAVTGLRKTLALEPAHLEARLSLARALASAGSIEAAVAEFREVLRRDPANADAWYGLAMNVASFDAADADRLHALFARDGLPARAHYLLGFALAKALEDHADFARAFDVLRAANASQRADSQPRWDAVREHARVEATLAAFCGGIAPSAASGRGREVILVTGMPRSGSTLVEHILASHPEVEGANEVRDMPEVIEAESRRCGVEYPAWVPSATPQDWQRLGEEYLARTARWRALRPRFTDKNLLGWHFAGAALAMLPAARVIIVRRDPVETCLACYRHCFTAEAGFACDLDDLADCCGDFLRLARFWLQRYPQRVFAVQYEALVADPEPVIRGVLDFCGLPFDAACLRPHRTSRVVMTPSAAQVRRPLHDAPLRSGWYGSALDHLRQRLRAGGALAA